MAVRGVSMVFISYSVIENEMLTNPLDYKNHKKKITKNISFLEIE